MEVKTDYSQLRANYESALKTEGGVGILTATDDTELHQLLTGIGAQGALLVLKNDDDIVTEVPDITSSQPIIDARQIAGKDLILLHASLNSLLVKRRFAHPLVILSPGRSLQVDAQQGNNWGMSNNILRLKKIN